jgi:hypothetical protein
MRTSELTDSALDWAVAKAEGRTDVRVDDDGELVGQDEFDYSTDWAQGGPIIEREKMRVAYNPDEHTWEAGWDCYVKGWGDTPLIAAMRCYVASRLGDEVEIPEELR